MNFISSWRTALRVARREAARAKGRSALVVAMIGLPVLCLAFAAVSYDMFHLSPAENADRAMGTADARAQPGLDAHGSPSSLPVGRLGRRLPGASPVIRDRPTRMYRIETSEDQSGYSSLRHERGSDGWAVGVRSSSEVKYGATNGSGAITVYVW